MSKSFKKTRTAAALAVAGAFAAGLLSLTPSAYATLQLQIGPGGGNAGTDNVIFNACGTSAGPALTVQGCLNNSNTTLVNFTSNENLEISGGGQAQINAEDGAFDQVNIALDDPALGFSTLIFNLTALADGTADFLATDQFGNDFVFDDVPLDATGENFFKLFSNDNQVAVSFSVVSTVAIQNLTDLQQVRLGPTEINTEVPEPATLVVLGSALLGFGILRRRRRS